MALSLMTFLTYLRSACDTEKGGGFAEAWKFQGYNEHKCKEFDSHILESKKHKGMCFPGS